MLLEPQRLRVPPWVTRVEYSHTVDSTNDVARRLSAEHPRPAGLLAVAEEQTAGRGRGANRWWTGHGSLAFSLLFDPARYGIETRFSCMVPLAAATAIVDVVTTRLPCPAVGIRWPNDVYVGRRKLAGVLVEALPDGRQILGIGCNVNNSIASAPAEVADIVTAIVDETGAAVDRTEMLSQLVASIDGTLARLAADRTELASTADECCLQRGEVLHVALGEERITGVCAGIAADGALLLDTVGGRRTLYSGVVLRT